jgi:hypothetical protein
MIVGKPSKLNMSIDPYVSYIRGHLIPGKAETIYVIGRLENKKLLDDICNKVNDSYEICSSVRSRAILRHSENRIEEIEQYVVIMRLHGINVFQSSINDVYER